MLKWSLASGHQVQGWVRNLIHRLLSPEIAAALTALDAMLFVIVLRSHQPQGSAPSPGVNNNLSPGCLSLKLEVTHNALIVAVLCVIMLGNR